MVRTSLWCQLNSVLKPRLLISELNLSEPQFHHLSQRRRELSPDTSIYFHFWVFWGEAGFLSSWALDGWAPLVCHFRSQTHLFSCSRDFRMAPLKGSLLGVTRNRQCSSLPSLSCLFFPASYPSPPPCLNPYRPGDNGSLLAWREVASKGQQAQPTRL